MNLPSIFKSAPTMKNTTDQNLTNKNIGSPNEQDGFGLGIQVFKIQSKKQIVKPKNTTSKSISKLREEVKNAQIGVKRISNIPPVPKRQKKVSGNLPKLESTSKDSKWSQQIRTENITSKKQIQKPSSSKKLDTIKQAHLSISKRKGNTNPQQNKKCLNKSVDAMKQTQQVLQKKQLSLTRTCWLQQLNCLPNFYDRSQEFEKNELTKAGKKTNIEFFQRNNTDNFIDAFVAESSYFYDDEIEYQLQPLHDYMEKSFSHSYENYDAVTSNV